MATQPIDRSPLAALEAAVGADALVTDPAERAFYAHDVYAAGADPVAVFRPRDTDELARGIRAAAEAGLAIVPRGGGMSYTGGYTANTGGQLIVDTGRMDRILSIDETDMLVTVEAGCTWAKLYEALSPKGLQTPLWGTLSGIKATVGGGMSQNGLFWGAGRGSLAPTALAYEVVLADGSVIKTGNGFFRPYGPDVTGLFGADAGAFGIKAAVTLPLMKAADALAYGTFVFDTPEGIFGAMSEVGREGLASESFGFDPYLQAQRMKRDSLATDAKALVGMMKAQGGFWKAVKEGAKVVAAGRSFLDGAPFSAHFVVEGRDQRRADEDLARIDAVARKHGGRQVENTIPKVLRSGPFPAVNSMVGPNGERWVPVHAIVRHSKAIPTIEAIIALYEANAAEMERLEIGAGYMFLTISTTAFLIEPVFYWPDEIDELHRRSLEPKHLARIATFPRSDAGRALVHRLRQGVIDICGEQGGMHFQLGRTYPLKERSDPGAWTVLEAVKAAVDPDGRMNPGALGL